MLEEHASKETRRRTALRIVEQERPRLPVLAPGYLEQFQCIGPACEDSCCQGWSAVTVDSESLTRYAELEDRTLSQSILRRIEHDPNARPGAQHQMQLREDSRCAFLEPSRLCEIHRTLGEEYLCDTCKMYPRVTRCVHGVFERAATLSCPEAARLALLNPEGIDFTIQQVDVWPGATVAQALHSADEGKRVPLAELQLQAREFLIEVLQNRRLPFEPRLQLLGYACRAFSRAVNLESASLFREELGNFRKHLALLPSHVDVDTRYSHQAQIQLLRDYFRFSGPIPDSGKRYAGCVEEIQKALQLNGPDPAVSKRYRKAIKKYYLPFEALYPHILENYLVHQTFRNLFPSSERLSMFDSYVLLILKFSLVRSQLIGLGLSQRGITPELVILLVQSFSKAREHRTYGWEELVQSVRKNGHGNMEFLSLLIAR